MPKETKETEKINKIKQTTTKAKASTSKTTTTVKAKNTENKKTTTTKTSTKKNTTKKATSKASVAKKTQNTKSTKKSSSAKLTTSKQNVAKVYIPEYYDLPYRYNETVVKLLFQTPKTLFVYWDISDEDRKIFIEKYGENFFSETKPVLLVHNKTLNYSFELDINDFANCWYFDVNDAQCEYTIELGRRPITSIKIPNNYLQIAASNKIEIPNNRILFDKTSNNVFFKNVKINNTFSKNITTMNFMTKVEKIYNIYDVYKKIYTDESIINSLDNPSSNFEIF